MLFMSKLFLLLYSIFMSVDATDCPVLLCVCDMSNGLRTAKCNGRHLSSIEANVPSTVQQYDLANNVIHQLTDNSFMELNMRELIVINVSSNIISEISLYAFSGLTHLQIVDLSNNALQNILPNLFDANPKLRILYLRGNKFVTPNPGVFLQSQSLRILDISNCLISHLYPETFSMLPNLSTLDISNNFLIDINKNVFEHVTNLNVLNYTGNQWKCNAKIRAIEFYLTHKNINFQRTCKMIVEKSQKMIMMPATEIPDAIVPNNTWIYDDIKTSTAINNRNENYSNCIVTYQSTFSLLVLIITFTIGTFLGVSITCLYVICINLTKQKQKQNQKRSQRKRRSRYSFNTIEMMQRRARGECLLNDTQDNYGLSTPILQRVGTNNHTMQTSNYII